MMVQLFWMVFGEKALKMFSCCCCKWLFQQLQFGEIVFNSADKLVNGCFSHGLWFAPRMQIDKRSLNKNKHIYEKQHKRMTWWQLLLKKNSKTWLCSQAYTMLDWRIVRIEGIKGWGWWGRWLQLRIIGMENRCRQACQDENKWKLGLDKRIGKHGGREQKHKMEKNKLPK